MYAVYWLGATAVFLFVEILTLGLTSIWFAGGAFVAAVAAFVGQPIYVQFILFIVVTCALFVLTRPWAKKYLNNKVEKTNVEALQGQQGIVKETIQNKEGKGIVFINGLDWSAKSLDGEEIEKDTEVIVHEIQGVKLIVEAVEEKEE